jgi:mannosyltransferase OCH1-like enzyme
MSGIVDIYYNKLQSSRGLMDSDYSLIFRRENSEFISVETVTLDGRFSASTISYITPVTRQKKMIQITQPNQRLLLRGDMAKYNVKIPKRIVCTWKTKDIVGTDLEYSVEVMKKMNPEYEFEIFDDSDCRNFIADTYDERVLKAYDDLIPGAFKADLWRYCYLYKNGGVYLDIKTVCVKTLDSILNGKDMFLVRDIENTWIYNGVMAIIPEHPLLKITIDEVVRRIEMHEYGKNLLDITGPAVFGTCFNRWIGKSDDDVISMNIMNDTIYWCYLDTTMHKYINNSMNMTMFYRLYSTYYKGVNKGKDYPQLWDKREVFRQYG